MAKKAKTHFTFSYFDAAHTDGYVVPTNGEFKRSYKQVTSNGGRGFFSDDEEDEDSVTKIHHWKQTNIKGDNAKTSQMHREVQNLFTELVKKESAKPEPDETISIAINDIQLNRLLDDYMLGEKGDRIMQQMEELTTDAPPSPVQKLQPQKGHKSNDEQHELSPDLDAMVLMEDFEKYIAEN